MRDLDGNKVISWPEYWVAQAELNAWVALLVDDQANVTLQTF